MSNSLITFNQNSHPRLWKGLEIASWPVGALTALAVASGVILLLAEHGYLSNLKSLADMVTIKWLYTGTALAGTLLLLDGGFYVYRMLKKKVQETEYSKPDPVVKEKLNDWIGKAKVQETEYSKPDPVVKEKLNDWIGKAKIESELKANGEFWPCEEEIEGKKTCVLLVKVGEKIKCVYFKENDNWDILSRVTGVNAKERKVVQELREAIGVEQKLQNPEDYMILHEVDVGFGPQSLIFFREDGQLTHKVKPNEMVDLFLQLQNLTHDVTESGGGKKRWWAKQK